MVTLGIMNLLVQKYTQVPSYTLSNNADVAFPQNRTPLPARRQPPLLLLHLAARVQAPLVGTVRVDAGVFGLRMGMALENRYVLLL